MQYHMNKLVTIKDKSNEYDTIIYANSICCWLFLLNIMNIFNVFAWCCFLIDVVDVMY